MYIVGYVPHTDGEEIEMEHDDLKFTIRPVRISSGEPVLGSYTDISGLSHLVFRGSTYGRLVLDAFIDSRKYNPHGWTDVGNL